MDQLGTLSKSLTYDTLICMERIEINFICTKRRPNEDINKCWSSVHNFGKSGLSSERAACCNFFAPFITMAVKSKDLKFPKGKRQV
jgi:hypothetical protein